MAEGPLLPPRAPNLPLAPMAYTSRYNEQLNNILRLYFNTVDTDINALIGTSGGRYLNIPHIAASDSTDQYAPADNTPVDVKWDTLDSGAGFSLSPPGSATPEYTGVYKITFSLQFANTANAVHDAVVWLRVNGADVPNSATSFSISARKSAGVPSFLCCYSEVVFTVNGGDVVELLWATDKAYNPVGPVDGVYMFADAAQTSPYARPAIPSAIGSITFVSDTR